MATFGVCYCCRSPWWWVTGQAGQAGRQDKIPNFRWRVEHLFFSWNSRFTSNQMCINVLRNSHVELLLSFYVEEFPSCQACASHTSFFVLLRIRESDTRINRIGRELSQWGSAPCWVRIIGVVSDTRTAAGLTKEYRISINKHDTTNRRGKRKNYATRKWLCGVCSW